MTWGIVGNAGRGEAFESAAMKSQKGVADDGLPMSRVGPWALQKYRLLDLYDTLFSTGMKRHWNQRVYVDLFCGPGRARIRGTGRVEETSPLIALRVPDRFDKYIFCDRDANNISALCDRVVREFPDVEATYVLGDCNEVVARIVEQVPRPSSGRSVLCFCFADPFGIDDLKVKTIQALSARARTDFLVLLALDMDANRFQSLYVKETSRVIDEFLDDPSWRSKWAIARDQGVDFRIFLAKAFASRMVDLGYLSAGLERMKEVRSDERNLPLYHLAFFSKHPRGYQFWDQVLKYGTDQLSLFQ
jgi:three-Cys-motif partner protein